MENFLEKGAGVKIAGVPVLLPSEPVSNAIGKEDVKEIVQLLSKNAPTFLTYHSISLTIPERCNIEWVKIRKEEKRIFFLKYHPPEGGAIRIPLQLEYSSHKEDSHNAAIQKGLDA